MREAGAPRGAGIETAGIVGAGIMGSGIAEVFAAAGLGVMLMDGEPGKAAAALE